jgi:hypothetical protein
LIFFSSPDRLQVDDDGRGGGTEDYFIRTIEASEIGLGFVRQLDRTSLI